jgi:3-hydroxyisobutyrate dehydrogenase-like beta-hydroxyacid dehydrogenase
MQVIECIAICEAFVVCDSLGIDKSAFLEVILHGSAMSNTLKVFLTESGQGNFFPNQPMLDHWTAFLQAMCVRAKATGLPYSLPQVALASIATLTSEMSLIAPTESNGSASLSDEENSGKKDVLQRQAPGEKVLVVGLGLMGIGIEKRLAQATCTLGYDIDSSKRQVLEDCGGQWCDDIQSDCQDVMAVVIVVESAQQVNEVLFDGPSPISQHLRADATIIIHSTVPSDCAIEIQKRLEQIKSGLVVMDAPMSGAPSKASQGELLVSADPFLANLHPQFIHCTKLIDAKVLIGGPTDRYEGFKPYLQSYTKKILPFPRLGLASQLKLIHNTVAGANLIAAAYTMRLGDSMGIEKKV